MREGRESAIYHVLFPTGKRLPVKPDYQLDVPGEDQVLPGAEMTCLQMSWMQSGRFEIFTSLVLRPVSGAPGIFERIGCVRIMREAGRSLGDAVELVYCSAAKETIVIV